VPNELKTHIISVPEVATIIIREWRSFPKSNPCFNIIKKKKTWHWIDFIITLFRTGDRPPFVLCEFHQLRCVLFYGEIAVDGRNEFVANMTSTNRKAIKGLKLVMKLKTAIDASVSGDQVRFEYFGHIWIYSISNVNICQ
jgi:hypothetical protein